MRKSLLLMNEPNRKFSAALTLVVTFAYLIAVPILYSVLGLGATPLSLLPVLTAAWFYGPWAGITSSILFSALNLVYLQYAGIMTWEAALLEGGGFGSLALLLAGYFVGEFGTLRARLSQELAERQQAQEELKTAKQYAELLFSVVPSAVFTVDTDRRIVSVNQEICSQLGYTADELIGKHCTFLAPDECRNLPCGLFDDTIPKPIYNAESTIRTKTGEILTVIKNSAMLKDYQGNVIGGVVSFADISQLKRMQEHFKRLSYHDPLTGLYNRRYIEENVNRLEQVREFPVSVILVDIDGLKKVNDSLGHEAGDNAIRQTAHLLRSIFRSSDYVARIGGDEFIVILPGANIRAAENAVKRLKSALRSERASNGQNSLNLSIGTATTDGSIPLGEAIAQADQSMYQDKLLSKNSHGIHTALPVRTYSFAEIERRDE